MLITTTSWVAITNTRRWRKRRSTSKATTSPVHSTVIVTHDPTCARPLNTAVRPGSCNSVSHLTTASSTAVTATAAPRIPLAKTTIVKDTSTTEATSQLSPVVCT